MKRDLNLIPRAETKSSVNKYILPVLLILVLYAATAYLAITIPQQRLQTKEDEYSTLLQQVADLEYVEVEYQLLRQQLAEVEAKKQTILLTKHSDRDAIHLLSIIEQACPEDIVLGSVFISPDGISISGSAQNDTLIAEFMVNLRAVEFFTNSNIARVDPAEADFAQVQQALSEGTELPETRQFQLSLAFSASQILDETQSEDS